MGFVATSMRGITSAVSNHPPVPLTSPCRNTTREIVAGLRSLMENHTGSPRLPGGKPR
jgi:hypothetical protein